MTQQHSAGTFAVIGFDPVEVAVARPVTTAMPAGIAVLEKTFDGEVDGRAVTLFVGPGRGERGAGTYVALESFDGASTVGPAPSTSSTPLRPTGRTGTPKRS